MTILNSENPSKENLKKSNKIEVKLTNQKIIKFQIKQFAFMH